MARTAIFSVLFPANLQYFRSFLSSLRKQTDQNFDLLLLVDSVDSVEDDILEFDNQFGRNWHIERLNVTGSIAAIRQQGFRWVRSMGYDFIVFADTDDLMDPGRVATCRMLLGKNPLVVSDIIPFGDEQAIGTRGYWQSRLKDAHTFSAADIRHYNFAGLGNTAVRTEIMNEIQIPESITAIDWFVFYQWLQPTRGVFTHHGHVWYRQHDANTIGIKRISEDRLRRVTATKIVHYENLVSKYPEFETELARHRQLALKLDDVNFCAEAVRSLNARHLNYFWWEETVYIE